MWELTQSAWKRRQQAQQLDVTMASPHTLETQFQCRETTIFHKKDLHISVILIPITDYKVTSSTCVDSERKMISQTQREREKPWQARSKSPSLLGIRNLQIRSGSRLDQRDNNTWQREERNHPEVGKLDTYKYSTILDHNGPKGETPISDPGTKKKKKKPKIHDDCTSNFHLGEEAGRQTTTTTITVLWGKKNKKTER